jgi:hypothetical protein
MLLLNRSLLGATVVAENGSQFQGQAPTNSKAAKPAEETTSLLLLRLPRLTILSYGK